MNSSRVVRCLVFLLGMVVGAGCAAIGVYKLYKIYKHRKVTSQSYRDASQSVAEHCAEYQLNLEVDARKPLHKISPLLYGSNLTPKTEYEKDVIDLSKELGITNFRFPGGESNGYRWQTGDFDFDDRLDDAPLSDLEHVIEFVKMGGQSLVIQVNLESGTPQEAAEWVRRMNKVSGFRVDYWEIGNEPYGDWDRAFRSPEEYAANIRDYARAMKAVDPTIKIGASLGGPNYPVFDRTVIKEAGDFFDFISYHWYPNHTNKNTPYLNRLHPLPEEVMANGLAIEPLVKRFRRLIARYAPQRVDKIDIGILEWDGSWDGAASDLNFEYKGEMWALSNAIFFADALGLMATQQVVLANQYSYQEVMHGLIRGWDRKAGWGGSRWDGQTIRPKGLAFQLLARSFGNELLRSHLSGSPAYNKETDWRADSFVGKVPYVTAYASQYSHNKKVAVLIVNKHSSCEFAVNLEVQGGKLGNLASWQKITGPTLSAQNDGAPGTVMIAPGDVAEQKIPSQLKIAPRSINLFELNLEK